ncbi:MAG TPA: cell envelope integrity protein CreD [Terriglobia bacterium]|nr:cell envelope integrity protein CreD [Candidatus Binatia bacterium]HET9217578.1 cell envelope integrity protein CreD [Terriglobia bacterium]
MSYIDQGLAGIQNSKLLRLCLVGVLALLLMIPIVMIYQLVWERQSRHETVMAEVASSWGNTQTVTGPALILPYTVRTVETSAAGKETERLETRHGVFLPKTLRATGRIDVETRSRGIFNVPVYRLNLSMEGEFAEPNLKILGIDPATVDWSRAHLALGISDVRAIREQSAVTWNRQPAAFLPGTGAFADAGAGIHAPVAVTPSSIAAPFSFNLSLNGSSGVYLSPFAEETSVQLTSNSPNPSFQGSWLPTDRSVSAQDGFDATWKVSYLGRNYPQSWIVSSSNEKRQAIEASRFGVQLTEPVDTYRMAERSVKYAILFILLTFASVWLIEILARTRVHPIQYLLLGSAMCVFYLLELSLAEHLPFPIAYGIACLAVVTMIAAYSRVIFKHARHMAVITAGTTVLYGYLFVLLTNEDAALLVGSIGLFASIAGIMFATRGIDWYREESTRSRLPSGTSS